MHNILVWCAAFSCVAFPAFAKPAPQTSPDSVFPDKETPEGSPDNESQEGRLSTTHVDVPALLPKSMIPQETQPASRVPVDKQTSSTLSEAIGQMFTPDTPHDVDKSRVVAVFAQGSFSSVGAQRAEQSVRGALQRSPVVVATLGGQQDFGMEPSPTMTPEALLQLAVSRGADDVVVIRTIGVGNRGDFLLQRLVNSGQVVSVVVTAPQIRIPLAEDEDLALDQGNQRQGNQSKGSRNKRLGLSRTASRFRTGDPGVVSAENTEAYRKFRRQALRISPRRTFSGWGQAASTIGFSVYSPNGKRLTRAETERVLGHEQSAAKIETLQYFQPWAIAGGAAVVLLGTAMGMGVGALLGLVGGPTATSNDFVVLSMLGGTLGMAVSTLPGLGVGFAPMVLEPLGADKQLESVRVHNLVVADKVGLPRDEVPFVYLGF